MSEEQKQGAAEWTNPQPYAVRLPGFSAGSDVGLGDAVKKMTAVFGIRPAAAAGDALTL